MQTQEIFLLLINLMPTVLAENQLRLLCAIAEFKNEVDTQTQKAKGRKIKAMFLHAGAPFEVTNVPSHLVKLELAASCDQLHALLLDQLSEVPEVHEVLGALGSKGVTSSPPTLESLEMGSSDESAFGDTGSVFGSYYGGSGMKEEHGDLAVMAQLEQIIANARSRHALVNQTAVCEPELRFGVKIRFVAAVDQCLRCEDEEEASRLCKKIGIVFFQTGGMFSIALHDPRLTKLASTGKLSALEAARVQILKELSLYPEMVDWIRSL